MSDPTVTALTAADLDDLRQMLQRLRAENEADLLEARTVLATMVEDGTRGTASMREVEANAEYMVQDASQILSLIDAALARMDDGSYGLCRTCRQPIPVERLELRPYGATCVPCSS